MWEHSETLNVDDGRAGALDAAISGASQRQEVSRGTVDAVAAAAEQARHMRDDEVGTLGQPDGDDLEIGCKCDHAEQAAALLALAAILAGGLVVRGSVLMVRVPGRDGVLMVGGGGDVPVLAEAVFGHG